MNSITVKLGSIGLLLVVAGNAGVLVAQQQPPVHTARPIEPVRAKEIQRVESGAASAPGGARVAPKGLDAFAGAWQLLVEGAVRTDENAVEGTRQTTVGAGALGRRLVIRMDGTYTWGDVAGRWRATGESLATGWPIVLLKADHGRDWKVGWDTRRAGRRGDILVWDGDIWEVGRPAR